MRRREGPHPPRRGERVRALHRAPMHADARFACAYADADACAFVVEEDAQLDAGRVPGAAVAMSRPRKRAKIAR